MKKIIFAISAVITMLIFTAQPLICHAETQWTGVSGEGVYGYVPLENILSHYGENLMYYYVTSYAGDYKRTGCLLFDDAESIETSGTYNGYSCQLIIRNPTLNGEPAVLYLHDISKNGSMTYDVLESTCSNNIFYVRTNGQAGAFNYNGSTLTRMYINSAESRLEPIAPPLNVLVDFSPDLIGNVDRQITAIDGTKSMRKDLAMQVVNQSNFPIQYDMRIYKVNQSSSRDWSLNPETFATQFDSDSVSYDDDPIFIYYKNEWVYTTNYDSESTFWDLEPVKENKGASWHYLAANSQDIVTFNFTQINLDENVDYYVEVRAVRNDYGCSSEKIVYSASDDPAESEYKQIQGDDIVTVYHEQFKMINYSDVVYNPNEDSNGVLPYNGKNGIVSRNTYQYGRNARDNGNGNIDYTARNLYTDQNSWYNQQYHRVVSNHTSIASSGSVPSNITNLFDSFMKFVSYVFLRFPANMQTIYVYGFVSVVVLGIVLKVIK